MRGEGGRGGGGGGGGEGGGREGGRGEGGCSVNWKLSPRQLQMGGRGGGGGARGTCHPRGVRWTFWVIN